MPNVRARLSFDTLSAEKTTDTGADEPYLATFFARLDGTTVREDPADHNRLIPSISVVALGGRHGNIDSLGAGDAVQIPPAVGRYETSLVPIRLSAGLATRTLQLFAPGQLIGFAVVLEEDSSSDALADAIFKLVRTRAEERLNAFVAELNLGRLKVQMAGHALNARFTEARRAWEEFFEESIRGLREDLTGRLKDEIFELALDRAVDSGFGLIVALVEAADRDELVGSAHARIGEERLLTDGTRPLQSLSEVRQGRDADGPLYRIASSGTVGLRFSSSDVTLERELTRPVNGTVEWSSAPKGLLCVPEETFTYWMVEATERHVVTVNYPFCAYRYSIDGRPLESPQPHGGSGDWRGNIRIPAKAVTREEFDPRNYPFTSLNPAVTDVFIRFQVTRDPVRPQLQRLTLENLPSDGAYSYTLGIEAVLPNGVAVPVATLTPGFNGARIEFQKGFIERIERCLAPFLTEKYAKWKRLDRRGLWDPRERELRYEQLMELIDEANALGQLTDAREAILRLAARRAFGR